MQGSLDPRQPQFVCRLRVAALMLAAMVAAAPACAAGARVAGRSAHGNTQHAQGYLGIAFHDVTPDEATSLHLQGPHGAEVIMVDHDGPAGKAGLRPHDIILAVNGQVIDSASTLSRLIHQAAAGMTIALNVLRDGTQVTLNARLGDRQKIAQEAMQKLESSAPPPQAGTEAGYAAAESFVTQPPPVRPLPPDPPSRAEAILNAVLHSSPFTGLELETMPAQLAGYFGAPKGTGLLVSTVSANSPAATAGLHAGDIVLRADNINLHTPSDWTHHLRAVRGHPVKLTILRDKREQTLTLVPDLKHRSELRLRTSTVTA